jgi:hypothetical protein
MAVVNITGGNFTGNGSGTIYTCPSGRSARVELHVTRFGNTNQTAVAGATRRVGGSDSVAAFGRQSNLGNSYAHASHAGTIFVPSGTSVTFYDATGSYVAIEEDDG